MIIDLHCDLLSHPTFAQDDLAVRCSPEQLTTGGVSVQVCAMFTDYFQANDTHTYCFQNHLFTSLPKQYPQISHVTLETENLQATPISLIRSIENASLLGGDSEKFNILLHRLALIVLQGPLAYIGIVWNHKNRFGGGCFEPQGLSQDGRDLLEVMSILGIPLDLSHCSDRLTEDILDFKINKLPNLLILASHSNFRSIQNHCRNLIDEHAQELAKQGGIIGFNMLRNFLGNSLDDLQHHIQHARQLGLINQTALGTDFFYSEEHEKFLPECATAKDHPKVHAVVKKYSSESEYKSILHQAANAFLLKALRKQKESIHNANLFLNKALIEKETAF